MVAAKPDVFNHNLETVPSKYQGAPGARLLHPGLQRVKELDPTMFTKSGIMVGLGEERNEVLQLMDDSGQRTSTSSPSGSTAPSKKHHPVIARRRQFNSYATIARTKGFLLVSSSPLTRSSHHAGEDFAALRAARNARHA